MRHRESSCQVKVGGWERDAQTDRQTDTEEHAGRDEVLEREIATDSKEFGTTTCKFVAKTQNRICM